MKSFFRFFAERHILASLITLMTIMLGVSTIMGIKRDIYPKVDFGMMNILVRYPGASPEDVELNVTNKIEEELKSVSGIDNTTSISMENVSLTTVILDINEEDQDKIKSEIREAVARVTDLPDEVTESPLVTEMNMSSQSPVIEVGLTGDVPYRQLREEARLFEKKLRNIPGVSRLDKFGYRMREIKVEVSPDALNKYQIPMREVIAAIKSRNIQGTAGAFESYTSEKNLVTLAQFKNVQDVGDVIVRSTFQGPLIKVKDLAIINDDFEDARVLSNMNGKSAISFLVFINESADAIRVCDSVKELVEEEKNYAPEGVELLYVNDTSRTVRNSFDVVLNNGAIGLVLVILVLSLFLNIRTAFWVAMGIPVALLGTIYLLPMFDVYLDTITLTALILVLGIIVDDAIIISENIYRRFELGESPIEAAAEGIREVFSPVLTTILTTFLVFAPMFIMPGIFGKFIVVIPIAISIALFISLFEAMVALPAHIVPGLKRKSKEPNKSWFNPVRNLFRSIISKVLRFRYVVVVIFFVLLAGSFKYAGDNIKFLLFPSDMAESFFVVMELPTGTPLQVTADKASELEAIISQLSEDELASHNTRIGTNVLINAESENYAAMMINLTPYSERERNADQIVEDLRERSKELKGFEAITFSIVSGGPGVGKPINIRIVGSNDILRKQLADSVYTILENTNGVKDISRDDISGKDQVEIVINYDKLSRLGLTVVDIAQNVRIAYDGEVVTSIRYGDEDVDFRVFIEEKARKKLSYLNELRIPNNQNRLIPLSEIAWLKSGPGNSDFRHFEGERTINLDADVDQSVITPLEVTDAVFASFALERDYPGMQLTLGGEAVETEDSMTGLFRTMIIALIGVYFLLVLLFNSLLQPLLVMVAIPFGMMGVIAAFGFHGEPFSFVAIMGIIGLSGVVVNDSLVLVNHVNTLKKNNRDKKILDLVSDGTADRLRAIIITTLTTVAALLPLAYGWGGTAPFMAPMALALGWGLLFATPLTLLLVPSLYLIGQDIHGLFRRKIVK